MAAFSVIPLTEAPAQTVSIALGIQSCRINVYTKSINVPIQAPTDIPSDPLPTYENQNPIFLDLYVNDALIVGGVLCLNETRIVRDAYLGFIGDLAFIDAAGNSDPYGVPVTLPIPADLRNIWQRNVPLRLGGKAPPAVAGKCPGMGTRFILTYWPDLA